MNIPRPHKLNVNGFSHVEIIIVTVVIAVIASVGGYVSLHNSHANGAWAYIGAATIAQQNETVTVHACKFSVSSTVWELKGQFSLSSSYKNPNGFSWQGSIINTGNRPYPGHQSVYGVIRDTTLPSTILTTYVYNNANNYMSFSYSAGYPVKGGTSVMGNVAQNIRVGNLPTCP